MENSLNITDVLSFNNNASNNGVPILNIETIQWLYTQVGDSQKFSNHDEEIELIFERYSSLAALVHEGKGIIDGYKEMMENKITHAWETVFCLLNHPTFKTDTLLLQAGVLIPLKLKVSYISTLNEQSGRLSANLSAVCIHNLDEMIETTKATIEEIINDFKIFLQSI